MPYGDTLDKIFEKYFAPVCSSPFTYKGKTYHPAPLRVSPLLFRGFTCSEFCGACCNGLFTLDCLPFERVFGDFEERTVLVNGKPYSVFTNFQKENTTGSCSYLNRTNGRCGIHTESPLGCDFELIRFLISETPTARPHQLTQKLYGRGWAMTKVDGTRGAECEMTPPDDHSKFEVWRKLHRLLSWARYFELETRLPQIIDWVKTGPHEDPLII